MHQEVDLSPIDAHQSDYKPEAWRDYTFAELGNFVHLLCKRSEHRATCAKAVKDLDDAANYLLMMQAKLEDMRP